jgi:hypothetical protein
MVALRQGEGSEGDQPDLCDGLRRNQDASQVDRAGALCGGESAPHQRSLSKESTTENNSRSKPTRNIHEREARHTLDRKRFTSYLTSRQSLSILSLNTATGEEYLALSGNIVGLDTCAHVKPGNELETCRKTLSTTVMASD